jgi:hypothetical protein
MAVLLPLVGRFIYNVHVGTSVGLMIIEGRGHNRAFPHLGHTQPDTEKPCLLRRMLRL